MSAVKPEPKEKIPKEDIKSFISPSRTLETTAPLRWLKKGWQDFRRAPGHSLSYGIIMTFASVFISYWSYKVGSVTMVIVMLSGFIFIGPALAMGLYSISCQLEKNKRVNLLSCIKQGKKRITNQMLLTFVLLIVFLIWARAASMSHIFYPTSGSESLSGLLTFFAIGSAVGSIFAAIIFCATAFALPMIMDRDVDAITAILTSFNAVLKNKSAMLVWAGIIVFGILLGFATFFIGLMFFLPIIGHATWHGYRETIIADDWPQDAHTKL
jgi:uncharacterized membrane protein